MFFETMIETEDKSYYADQLEKLTGIGRKDWVRLTLNDLREHYARVTRKRRLVNEESK